MSFGETLAESLREELEKRQEKQRLEKQACDKMRAKIGSDLHAQFHVLNDNLHEMLSTISMCYSLTDKLAHMPSAKLGLVTAQYVRDAMTWCYKQLDDSQIDPEVYGLRPNFKTGDRLLSERIDYFQKFIDQHESNKASVATMEA